MKKYLLSLLVLSYSLLLFADSAYPDSIQVTQPDGTMLWIRIHGDEFYHWHSTTDGYILLKDSLQYYRYAKVVADSLIPSAIAAHNINNRSVNENQYLQSNAQNAKHFILAEQQAVGVRVRTERNSEMKLGEETTSGVKKVLNPNGGVHGKRKILTILMGFSDKPFTKTAADFDKLMNQKTGAVDRNKGSVWQFYKEDSYNNLDISATVVGPYTANFKSSHYQEKEGGDRYAQTTRELVREALHRASKHGVDFSAFDGDNDGYVDCVHIIFAGYGMSNNPEGLIWPHHYQLYSAIIRNGTKAKQYIVTPELYEENQIASMGTICHELGHVFGAPDFYDTQNPDENQYYATGKFDLMCNGEWNDDGRCPSHHSAYTKCFLFGWGTPEMITATTKTYQLPSSTLSPRFYRIDTHTDGEFFLLENRSKTNFDAFIPNAGLVVYHIHKDLPTAIEDNDPINSGHPLKCYIVNAAATGNPTASSASYGAHNASRAFSGSNMFFTSTSTPSLKAWDGSSTGVNLCFIRQSGNNVEFTVNPQIQGLSQLCGEETYCIGGNVPGSASISWRYSSPIKPASKLQPVLRIKDADSDCAIVQRGFEWVRPIDSSLINPPINPPIQMSVAAESSASLSGYKRPYVGNATLFVTVSSAGEEYTLSKTITLPQNIKPSLNINPLHRPIWVVGQEFSFTEQNCGSLPADQIKWYVRYPQATEDVVLTGRTVRIKPTTSGKLTIRIVNDCGCETKNEVTYTFSVSEQHVQLQYTNPANGSVLNVKVVNNAAVNTLAAPMQTYMCDSEEKVYTIELWSGTLGKISSITTSQDQVNIDIAGLPNGWYQLLLVQDGEIIETDNVLLNK